MLNRSTIAKGLAITGCVTGIVLIGVGATVASAVLFPGVVLFMVGAFGMFIACMDRNHTPVTSRVRVQSQRAPQRAQV